MRPVEHYLQLVKKKNNLSSLVDFTEHDHFSRTTFFVDKMALTQVVLIHFFSKNSFLPIEIRN